MVSQPQPPEVRAYRAYEGEPGLPHGRFMKPPLKPRPPGSLALARPVGS